MAEIEACPLCGGPGRLKDSLGRQVRQGWVGCPACGLYISWKISPDGAVRKWNRRAPEDGLQTTIALLKHQLAAMETIGGSFRDVEAAVPYADEEAGA